MIGAFTIDEAAAAIYGAKLLGLDTKALGTRESIHYYKRREWLVEV